MMPQSSPNRRNYAEILADLKLVFPSPVSDPVMDGYFIHTASRFLSNLDDLKSQAPVLGVGRERNYERHCRQQFPEEPSSVEEIMEMLVDHCQGMTIWSHPNAAVNVVPPPAVPGIMAFIAAAMYNPNTISDAYSFGFAEAEIESVALLSDLIGYDPERSAGVFTFGGTGTNLYGCRLAIEKMSGGHAMSKGVRQDMKIVTSDASHYSRLNVAGWLGLGTENIVVIPTTRDNEMSLIDLEDYLRRAFESGEKVAAILVTMGTTDAFGIDDLAGIVRLRDKLADEYHVEHPPHVHADAVIGWAWAVFRTYDFDENPLGFHARTLRSLRDSVQRIGNLAMADSIGIDLHKTGYAPYICSVFLARDRNDLTLLSRQPEQMPYLFQYGNYHPGIYTLECSRSGASPAAALANIHLLGKVGYQALIGHVVEMAEMLREELERHPSVAVLNDYNYGPVTLFRVYPDGVDADEALHREMTDPAARDIVLANNAYNSRISDLVHEQAIRGEGVLLSRTDAYRHASYPDGPPILALKSFIMSPWTDLAAVSTMVRQVLDAREKMAG